MITFATEFPTKPVPDKAAFVAQILSWLRGTRYSTVLESPNNTDLDGDFAEIRASSGEELLFRELARSGEMEAIGVRHDFPDADGRLWRTEVVLRRSASGGAQDLLRLCTQCIAQTQGARLGTPKKPYLVKAVLKDLWGGKDEHLSVSDEPHWLDESDRSVEIASAITSGAGSRYLPIVYISTISGSDRIISDDRITKLAYDLGGVAHVVVEPSRAFSFRLREIAEGDNAYGGTIAICLPGRGIVRKFYFGLRIADVEMLISAIHGACITYRSHMPAEGWDWTELQELALKHQRERDRKRLSPKEITDLYEYEIKNLKERITQLEEQLSSRILAEEPTDDDGPLADYFSKSIGAEIYSGEFSDRIRYAAARSVEHGDKFGMDQRTKYILEKIVEKLPVSQGLKELLEDLQRAVRDPKRIAGEVTALLSRHGYREKSDNKHIRLEPLPDFPALANITLPKTPSDKRGLLNQLKQIKQSLGLTKLSD